MRVSEVTPDQLLSQALAWQQAGNIDLAKTCCEEVLTRHPQHVQALQLLGIVHAISMNFPLAVNLFTQAIDLDPLNAQVLFNRANAYFEQKLLTQALADLELALAIEPDNALGLLTQGNVYFALKQNDQALASFDKALTIESDWSKALNNRGLVLKERGQLTEAFKSFSKAIANDPKYADGFNNLGILLLDLGHADQAVKCFEAAISLRPENAEAYNNFGNALNVLEKYQDALHSFDTAIALKPDYAEAYSNRSSSLEGLMRLDEAIQSCEIALHLNGQMVKTHNKLAVMLKEVGALEKALTHLRQAMALKPDFLDGMINMGNVLSLLKQFEASLSCFDHVLSIEPDNDLAKWNKSLLCLQLGDYANGWRLYEAGWAIHMRGYSRQWTQPLWTGEANLANKTVLLHAEQGLGDTLQFCRYVPLVKRLGARVLLELPTALMSLLKNLEGVDECVEAGQPLPAFDCHCPLMSLPLAFQTTLQTIPSPTAYLKADAQKVQHWFAKLKPSITSVTERLKVGVVWNGGHRPYLPNVWWVNQRRNITLELFASFLTAVEADFYSLQKGEPAESDIRGQELRYWPQGNFFNPVEDLHDFSDTAALIANLDLVVSVDTSTAHLAAAMGKPTWILSRYDNCWRWLEGRDDSPWYASVKLYRQGPDRNWAPTLARLANDLQILTCAFSKRDM